MRDVSTVSQVFGQGADTLIEFVSRLEHELAANKVGYSYCAPDEFQRLLVHDTPRAQYLYWAELIGRAHFASVSSILRSSQWIRGAVVAHEAALYLPFCANVRAFIESSADSLTGLSGVAQTIAENRALINDALNKRPGPLAISAELENQLIHFSHARKLTKGESAPASHAANSAKGYIDTLEKLGLADAYSIYGKLCQVTHPAADSVTHFLTQTGEAEFVLAAHNDRLAISKLLQDHQSFFHNVLRYAFNPSIILLRVIQHVDLHQYHCRQLAHLDLSQMQGWHRAARTMGVTP